MYAVLCLLTAIPKEGHAELEVQYSENRGRGDIDAVCTVNVARVVCDVVYLHVHPLYHTDGVTLKLHLHNNHTYSQ